MPNEFGCKIPFKAGEGIPLELNPPMGGELAEETLDLAPGENQRWSTFTFYWISKYEQRPVSGNLVKTSPVVGFQSQPPGSV